LLAIRMIRPLPETLTRGLRRKTDHAEGRTGVTRKWVKIRQLLGKEA